jgi:hypothetical protein
MEQSGQSRTRSAQKEHQPLQQLLSNLSICLAHLLDAKSHTNTRLLPIPSAIDDYNYHIGGVDIADQLQAGFSTQQRGVKL